jgi:hypothetical protein
LEQAGQFGLKLGKAAIAAVQLMEIQQFLAWRKGRTPGSLYQGSHSKILP